MNTQPFSITRGQRKTQTISVELGGAPLNLATASAATLTIRPSEFSTAVLVTKSLGSGIAAGTLGYATITLTAGDTAAIDAIGSGFWSLAVELSGVPSFVAARGTVAITGPAQQFVKEGVDQVARDAAAAAQAASAPASHLIAPDAHGAAFACSIPEALAWDAETVLAPSLQHIFGSVSGSAGVTAEEVFGLRSVALSAPSATYYVNYSTGNDTNGGLSAGAAVKSIWKAVALANAGGVPSKIVVAAGAYPRSWMPGNGTTPTVDVALVASGGRVVTGTWDTIGTLSVGATYTQTYVWTLTNVERVVDRSRLDRFGDYIDLVRVESAPICNATPNSWYTDGTTLYIHRLDGAQPTDSNSRVFRAVAQSPLAISGGSPKSMFCEGFDFEGGGYCSVSAQCTALPKSPLVLVLKNCSMKYAGGALNTGGCALLANSWHGVVGMFDCHCSKALRDGYNFHNTSAAGASTFALLVNCTATDCGSYGQTSCNALTLHEDCIGIDIAGRYESCRGGTIRNIGTSKCLLLGTEIRGDTGDWTATIPTAVRVTDTAQVWAQSVAVHMPSATVNWQADAGAKIYRRNCAIRGADAGGGTFAAF